MTFVSFGSFHHDLQELANTYSVIVFRRAQALHSLKNHYLTLYFP